MGIQDFGTMDANASLKQVIGELANLMDTLNFLLNGNLDVKNIRADSLTARVIKANSITADKLDVAQLSAITADMGTLTAGIIYGAYIATANGTYPRIEFSSVNSLLGAYLDATHSLRIEPNVGGAPGVGFYDPSGLVGRIYGNSGLGLLALINNIELTSLAGDIDINAGLGQLKFNGTDVMAEINGKAVSGGSTSSATVSDSHNHGFTTSDFIQCYDNTGVPTVKKQWVPYGGSASHSHTI